MSGIGILWGRRGRLKDIYATFLALADVRTPVKAKLAAAALIVYALLPLDFLPEYIPFVGIIDDLLIMTLGFKFVSGMVPEPIMSEFRKKAESASRAAKWILWILGGLFVIWIGSIILTIFVIARVAGN